MPQKRLNPGGEAGVRRRLARQLDTPEHSRDRRALQDSAEIGSPRFERMVERVHSLGPRPLGELLSEIATATGEPDLIADRLQTYAAFDADIVRALGGDKFPPTPLTVIR